MLWESIVGGLLGKVAPKVADYYLQKADQKHKIEMKKLEGKIAWEEAKTKRAADSEGFDHDWEIQSLNLHTKGWKDEFVLIVVSIPAIGVFIPMYEPYVKKGFESLGSTPLWYQILLSGVFFAIYGIRVYRRQAFEKNIMTEKGN